MYVCVIHVIMYYIHDMYYDYDVLCIKMYYVLYKYTMKTATPK